MAALNRETVFIVGQLILTIGITAITGYLYATGAPVPAELLGINGLIVGHYFGAATKTNGAFSAGRAYEREKIAPPHYSGDPTSSDH